MKYFNINETDTANGLGIRVSIFFSGCSHKCPGCFNEKLWDKNVGNLFTNEVINKIILLMDKEYIDGITLLGGEPLEGYNLEGTLRLIKEIREKLPNKTIWVYSGWTYEYLKKESIKNTLIKEILEKIDILVDGRFVKKLANLNLRFRGSSNQRIIDIKKTNKKGKVVLREKEK